MFRLPGTRSSTLSINSRPAKTPGTGSTSTLSVNPRSTKTPGTMSTSPMSIQRKSAKTKTPGTQSTSTVSGGIPKSFVIVAVVEGRGLAKGEIGLASMDLRHPELVVTQFSDSAAYAKLRVKLQILNPSELIVPDAAVGNGGNMVSMLKTLQQDLPKLKVTPVKRKFFNEGQGTELITRIMTQDSVAEKDIRDKYYALACAAALIRYIELIQNIVFARKSVKVVYKGTEKTCMIDLETAKHLELIFNLMDVTDIDRSLRGVLDNTSTPGGARMLRAALLQPSADLSLIQARLDAVTELKNDIPQFQSLRSLIGRMLDVDHLVAICSHLNREETTRNFEYRISQAIHLKHTLELVDPLRESVGRYSSPIFKSFFEMLADMHFEEILTKINEIFREETRYEKNALNMLSQKCFAVKANVNGYLDLARRTYSELVQDVEELCSDLATETGLPFTVAYTSNRGFYLQMRLRQDAPLPSEFDTSHLINVVRKNSMLSCTTRNLVKLNDRISHTVNEIFGMSNAIIMELLSEIRESITCLYNLTEVVSTIDFLCSLALFCTSNPEDCVKPEFSETMAISDGRHPLLEKVCEGPTYFPNDVYAGPSSNVIIVTGPNMAGKSTYLKMVTILQVMAQMGSYVPARYASFRVIEQIFSRIGQNDDLESNDSAFMLEMKDINYILQNVGQKSLIVIDELARSTSPEEGMSICHAVCEHLVNTGSFVFLATHFQELTSLAGLYPNVENYHFEGQIDAARNATGLVVNHILKRGPYRGPLYGFELAELADMPEEIISRAKAITLQIQEQRQISKETEMKRRKEAAIMRLGYRLTHAQTMEMDDDKFCEYLNYLKSRYMEDLEYSTRRSVAARSAPLSAPPSPVSSVTSSLPAEPVEDAGNGGGSMSSF